MVNDDQIQELALKIKVISYKRPEHVIVPTVWARFEGKTPRADGTIPRFRVQDITDEWIEPIVECIPQFLVDVMGEETMKACEEIHTAISTVNAELERLHQWASAFGLAVNPAKTQAILIGTLDRDLFERFNKAFWRIVMKDQVALMCLTDDEEKPRLAGFQMNGIETRLRTEEDCFTYVDGLKAISRTWIHMVTIRQKANIFETYKVQQYLDAFALFVKPEFRNQGLGYHIQKAKIPLAKALNIKVIANAFGSEVATHVAGKVGFKLIHKMPLSEVINSAASDGSDLSNQLPETGKFLAFKAMTVE